MEIKLSKEIDTKQPVLVYGITSEDKSFSSLPLVVAQEVMEAIRKKIFHPEKFGQQYTTTFQGKKIQILALGEGKSLTTNHLRRAMGKAVKYVRSCKHSAFATSIVHNLSSRGYLSPQELGRCAAEGVVLANYTFTKYLSAEKMEEYPAVETAVLQWTGAEDAFSRGLKEGKIIAEATNYARDLVNEPACALSPENIAQEAKKLASEKIKVKIIEKEELQKKGMNLLLGVAAGSHRPPKLIIVEYHGGGKEPWTAIIGKGITFDSGGYNLKPTRHIEEMKSDMAGGAAVLGTIKVAAALGVKRNILGVIPATDNLIGGSAQKPGDILRAYNGKTVEIGNTDAEGRLVLADALAYAEDIYKPAVMVDLATLTGACVVALGYEASGVMGKDEDLLKELETAGQKSHDRVWKLPFFEEYQDMMDGKISDLNNIETKGKGYEAGAIGGGVFLSKFIKKAKWAHIDIAGPAYLPEDTEYLCRFATGAGVRLLSYWLMKW